MAGLPNRPPDYRLISEDGAELYRGGVEETETIARRLAEHRRRGDNYRWAELGPVDDPKGGVEFLDWPAPAGTRPLARFLRWLGLRL